MTVQLKPIPASDAGAYHDMVADPTLSINTGSIPMGVDRDWAVERLALRRRAEQEGTRADRGLYVGGILVGMAGWFLNEEGEKEIGYAIHRDHRGKGLATKAAQLVIQMLRESDYDGPVYAQYFHDNPASGRVLEKLGFKHERSIEGLSASRGDTSPAWVMKLDLPAEV